MPTPDEVAAILHQARRMRAEVIARGAGALGRAVLRLPERIAGLFARTARA